MINLTTGVGFAYPQASTVASPRTAGLSDLEGSGSGTPGFSDVLKNTLQQVNQLESGAHSQVSKMLAGGGSDMSSVMISIEKADVAFQLMLQVRNKIVTAYQDIEKMQF